MDLLLVAVIFAAGGKITVELEVDSPKECALAYEGTRDALEARGQIRDIVGVCRAVA